MFNGFLKMRSTGRSPLKFQRLLENAIYRLGEPWRSQSGGFWKVWSQQGSQNLCEERSEGGEAVSPPSGPQEGARDAEGGPGGVKMRGFWSA